VGQVKHDDIQFSAPEKLTASHDVAQFECGEPTLDAWLKRRSLQNEESGASRTYVLCAGKEIAGDYALATGAIAHAGAAGRVKRNMPDPVPVIIIGRLAIASRFQGRGIGTALLRDAVLRTMQAAEIAGIRAILVHAISEQAKRFYEKHGFIPSPADPMTLMITVTEAARIFAGKRTDGDEVY
jgi:GNAT superfamily N-acetyltransferase